jgi:hypothetical protein
VCAGPNELIVRPNERIERADLDAGLGCCAAGQLLGGDFLRGHDTDWAASETAARCVLAPIPMLGLAQRWHADDLMMRRSERCAVYLLSLGTKRSHYLWACAEGLTIVRLARLPTISY